MSVSLSMPRFDIVSKALPASLMLTFAIAAHFLIWLIGSLYFVENLHYDTLELVYWGRDWMLGYGKHPPLATWIVDIAVRSGPIPLAQILLLAQVCVAVSAYYVWATARLLMPEQPALIAALVFLASPAASYFSLQVNHNSLLMPFWAASLYFALRHFRQPHWRSGLIAGVSAGLAMLVKYEVALLFLSLLVLAVVTPTYRRIFRSVGTWLGLAALAVVLTPHLMWLAGNNWSTVSYALDARDVSSWSDVLQALNNTAAGLGVLAVGPLLWFGIAQIFGSGFTLNRTRLSLRRDLTTAAILALAPPALLIIGAILSKQNPRQGWFLVFIPNVAVAVAFAAHLLQPAPRPEQDNRKLALSGLLSAGQLIVFMAFLSLSSQFGRPVLAFDLRSTKLAASVEEMWHDYQSGPLRCLVINEAKIGGSAILGLADRPNVVDFSSPFWSRPQRVADCSKSGSIVILNKKHPAQLMKAAVQNECVNTKTEVLVPTRFGGGGTAQSVEISYVPPEGEPNHCVEQDDAVALRSE